MSTTPGISPKPFPNRALFTNESTVAPVVPSGHHAPQRAKGHVVICIGKDISSSARAVKAGLKRLLPKPPKLIFAIPIATIPPITTIQSGIPDGRFIASSNPVTNAEPSLSVGSIRSTYRASKYSHAMHVIIDTNVTKSASIPKKYTPTNHAGSSAYTTSSIIRRVLL